MVIFLEEPGAKTEEDESANHQNPREENLEECKEIKMESEYPDTSKCKEGEQQIVEDYKLDQHGIGGHPCDQCEYVGSRIQHLEQHKWDQHGIGGHPCDQCEYVGAELKHLEQHKLDKHGIGGHPWDQEGYVGAELKHLEQHKWDKHCIQGHPCDQGGYVGAELKHLKQHKLDKHGIQGHPCDQCGYVGAELKHLEQHKRDKHGTGVDPCDEYNYVGAELYKPNYSIGLYPYRLRNLLGAIQKMLKIYRGHECNQCNYIGAELQDLKQHQLDKHGIGGHQCNQCGYVGSKFQLLGHYKSAHKFENKRKDMDQTGVHAKRIKEDVENIVKLEKQEGFIKQEVYVKSEPNI